MTGGSESHGWVIWITGLSGSGKTTIGKLLFQKLRSHISNVIFLDGDELRMALPFHASYSLSTRRDYAAFYGRLSRLLARQGQHVLISTISMFDDCRAWNRQNIENYFEIYLRAEPETLAKRSPNGLHAKALRGEVQEVVGFDLPLEEPKHPDLVIQGDGPENPGVLVEQIYRQLEQRLR